MQGIGPVAGDDVEPEADAEADGEADAEADDEADADEAEGGGARRLWVLRDAHAGAINCISTHGDLLATASRFVVSTFLIRNGR